MIFQGTWTEQRTEWNDGCVMSWHNSKDIKSHEFRWFWNDEWPWGWVQTSPSNVALKFGTKSDLRFYKVLQRASKSCFAHTKDHVFYYLILSGSGQIRIGHPCSGSKTLKSEHVFIFRSVFVFCSHSPRHDLFWLSGFTFSSVLLFLLGLLAFLFIDMVAYLVDTPGPHQTHLEALNLPHFSTWFCCVI